MENSTTPFDWKTALREQRESGRQPRLSMRWLAQETGKSPRTVYAYSRGDLVPPAEWIAAVSVLLGKDVAA